MEKLPNELILPRVAWPSQLFRFASNKLQVFTKVLISRVEAIEQLLKNANSIPSVDPQTIGNDTIQKMVEEHVRMMEARITKQIMEQLNVNVEQIVEVKFNEVTKQLDEKYDILRADIMSQVRTIDSSQSDRFDSVDAKFDKLQTLLANQGEMLQAICKQYKPTVNKPTHTSMEEESSDPDHPYELQAPTTPSKKRVRRTSHEKA
jgi:hypothetical protein